MGLSGCCMQFKNCWIENKMFDLFFCGDKSMETWQGFICELFQSVSLVSHEVGLTTRSQLLVFQNTQVVVTILESGKWCKISYCGCQASINFH